MYYVKIKETKDNETKILFVSTPLETLGDAMGMTLFLTPLTEAHSTVVIEAIELNGVLPDVIVDQEIENLTTSTMDDQYAAGNLSGLTKAKAAFMCTDPVKWIIKGGRE